MRVDSVRNNIKTDFLEAYGFLILSGGLNRICCVVIIEFLIVGKGSVYKKPMVLGVISKC